MRNGAIRRRCQIEIIILQRRSHSIGVLKIDIFVPLCVLVFVIGSNKSRNIVIETIITFCICGLDGAIWLIVNTHPVLPSCSMLTAVVSVSPVLTTSANTSIQINSLTIDINLIFSALLMHLTYALALIVHQNIVQITLNTSIVGVIG